MTTEGRPAKPQEYCSTAVDGIRGKGELTRRETRAHSMDSDEIWKGVFTMNDVYARIRELGYELPELPPPGGVYKPVRQVGNLLYVSGQGATVKRCV